MEAALAICLRYLAVWLVRCLDTSSGVPSAIISPPLSPPSGVSRAEEDENVPDPKELFAKVFLLKKPRQYLRLFQPLQDTDLIKVMPQRTP